MVFVVTELLGKTDSKLTPNPSAWMPSQPTDALPADRCLQKGHVSPFLMTASQTYPVPGSSLLGSPTSALFRAEGPGQGN